MSRHFEATKEKWYDECIKQIDIWEIVIWETSYGIRSYQIEIRKHDLKIIDIKNQCSNSKIDKFIKYLKRPKLIHSKKVVLIKNRVSIHYQRFTQLNLIIKSNNKPNIKFLNF